MWVIENIHGDIFQTTKINISKHFYIEKIWEGYIHNSQSLIEESCM